MAFLMNAAAPPSAGNHLRGSAGNAPAHDVISLTAAALNAILADTAILLAKTQACHWNAQGRGLHALREWTKAQCTELFTAMHVLAERVRALGVPAPDGLAQMLELTTLQPRLGRTDSIAATWVLAEDHAAMASHARDAAAEMEQACDTALHEILVARIAAHDKAAWLLRSHISPEPPPAHGTPR